MKKVLLLASACLFAFATMAQVATKNLDDVTLSENGTYNYQSSEIILNLENPLAVGDKVSVTLNGTISENVDGLQAFLIECSALNSWGWSELSEYQQISEAVTKGTVLGLDFEVVATKASEGKEIRLYIATTNTPVEGITSISINDNGEAPQPPYEDPILGKLASVWGAGNAVKGKTMTFAESNSGIGFANYDEGYDFSAYKSIVISLTEMPSWVTYAQIVVVNTDNDNTTVSFDGATATIDLTKVEGTVKQIYLQCGGTGNVTLKEITFSTESADVPDPAYVDDVLGTLSVIWGDGNAISGKTMTYAASDSGIGFANYDAGFDLSAYKSATFTLTEFPEWATYGQIIVKDVNDNEATFPFEGAVSTIDLTQIEANVKQFYLQMGGTGKATIASIEFSADPVSTAVEDVTASEFAVVDGMVYSAGEIVVYNVAGKVVATASQVFNVDSLTAGVYFISAQEGTIKFVK